MLADNLLLDQLFCRSKGSSVFHGSHTWCRADRSLFRGSHIWCKLVLLIETYKPWKF